jgi:hypothetical protein
MIEGDQYGAASEGRFRRRNSPLEKIRGVVQPFQLVDLQGGAVRTDQNVARDLCMHLEQVLPLARSLR